MLVAECYNVGKAQPCITTYQERIAYLFLFAFELQPFKFAQLPGS